MLSIPLKFILEFYFIIDDVRITSNGYDIIDNNMPIFQKNTYFEILK